MVVSVLMKLEFRGRDDSDVYGAAGTGRKGFASKAEAHQHSPFGDCRPTADRVSLSR